MLSLTLVSGLACTPDLAPIEWDAVDIEALRNAIANPTGIVDEASSKEVADSIVEGSEAYRLLAAFIHAVFVADEGTSPDASVVWVVPQALGGTSVYALVACPGDSLDGEASFANGFLRVDSPTITADLISTFAIEGSILLGFSACQIGDYVFDGGGPAYHGTAPVELAFVPTQGLRSTRGEDQTLVLSLDEPVMWELGGAVSLLFTLSSGATLALDLDPLSAELQLRGVNGALTCEITPDGLVCTTP